MSTKPNIVIVITDSQGWNLLGECGSGNVKTPNIDRLAKEGVVFNRAYNTCPLCAPARAGLFTGQYPHNAGAWGNDLPIGDNVKTIGQYFQKAGYRTGYIGKWHLDGFDYFGTGIAPEGYEAEYWYDGRNYLDEMTEEEKLLWRKGLNEPEAIHEMSITREFTWGAKITDKAIGFLQQEDEKPFLLVVSYDEPHGPSTCPPPYCDMYKDKKYPLPENYNDDLTNKPAHHKEWALNHFKRLQDAKDIYQPMYFGCATFVDSEIGKVINAVDKKSKDNTIVVFTTDHGHYLGAHKLDGKGPALYEEVVRVPLIFRSPGNIPEGKQSDSIVSHIDLIPTLMEYAGLETYPILEGKSMKRTLENPAYEYREEALIEFHRQGKSHDGYFGFIPIRCLVNRRYKLVINLHQTDELYDLEKDPGEMINLIEDSKYFEIRNDMHEKLLELMDKSRDPFRGTVWAMRQWRPDRMSLWEKGQRRCRPDDGFLPTSYDYDTGMPDR